MGEGKLTTTVVLSHGNKQNSKSKGCRMEEKFPVEGLRSSEDAPESRVTQAVSTKVSDAVYYGEGTWDKIPYTVEVFSSVSLVCDQESGKILAAQNIAHQAAFESGNERLRTALVGHVSNIRNNLYSGLFNED